MRPRFLPLPARWPLSALLLLYPLWWALGLGVLIYPILAVPMALALLRRRPIQAPPGFALWLLFLAAAMISLTALELDPPGTVSGSAWDRLPGVTLRLTEYASLTVLLLYVGNLRHSELPQRLLIRLLAWSFLITVAGGLAGVLWPHLDFSSPAELLLPEPYAENRFVQTLTHPALAQQHEVLGHPTPRPAAPWGYTNIWGNNFFILVVWFVVAGWTGASKPRARTLRRVATAAVLALAVAPVVISLNRGLWLGLAVAVAHVAARMVAHGRTLALGALGASAAAVALALAITPLGHLVTARLANGHSNGIRMYTTERAVTGVAHSPVIGFGSTRDTLGSGSSIAVGPSPECGNCGNHTIGSNGQLWLVLYAHGILGAALFLGFFCHALWRHRHDSSIVGVAASTVLILNILASGYYNTLITPLGFTFLSYAVLWRQNTMEVTGR